MTPITDIDFLYSFVQKKEILKTGRRTSEIQEVQETLPVSEKTEQYFTAICQITFQYAMDWYLYVEGIILGPKS